MLLWYLSVSYNLLGVEAAGKSNALSAQKQSISLEVVCVCELCSGWFGKNLPHLDVNL